ncbi:MAG TPA: asparaginase domain-containing protein, partial [Vicinamibacterales bacterium]|nr:asparaginase domain-containing protein [Vicinamibacterales bacterium]
MRTSSLSPGAFREPALLAIGVLTVVLALPWAARSQPVPDAAPKPRVRLVATGGTISNKVGGRLTATQLVQEVPGLDQYVTPEYEQFTNTASSYVTLEQWVGLTHRINELFRTDPGLAGIVVTSGT